MNLLKNQGTEEIVYIEEVMECKWNEQLDFFQAYCWHKVRGFSYSLTPGSREAGRRALTAERIPQDLISKSLFVFGCIFYEHWSLDYFWFLLWWILQYLKKISVLLWKLLCCFSTPYRRISKNLRGLFRISIGLVSLERYSHTEIVIKNKIWHQYESLLYEDQPRSNLLRKIACSCKVNTIKELKIQFSHKSICCLSFFIPFYLC